jgi:glycosyltransferase involved in cell wall biosynthesis
MEKLVLNHYPEVASFVKFYRNISNIGLGANLLRCFERSGGQWTWLLGDDDIPVENAITKILAEIDAVSEDDFLIKFNSSNGGQVSLHERIHDLEELANYCKRNEFYSNLLFISSSIFKTSVMINNLSVGYHWNYTLSPHVAIIIKYLSIKGSICLIPQQLVIHGRAESEQQWNFVRLITGFTALADIEGAELFNIHAMPHIMRNYMGGRWLRSMAKAFLIINGRSMQFWRIHFLRVAGIYGGFTGFLITQAVWLIPLLNYIPSLRACINYLLGGQSAVKGLNRS